jgi:hypothetical protein
MTMWSYCSQIQRREASAGELIKYPSTASWRSGAGTVSGATTGCGSVLVQGRS